MADEVKTASVWLQKKEFTRKKDSKPDAKGKVIKAGEKDHFWTGQFYVGSQAYDITWSGVIFPAKDKFPDATVIEIKERGKGSNRL